MHVGHLHELSFVFSCLVQPVKHSLNFCPTLRGHFGQDLLAKVLLKQEWGRPFLRVFMLWSKALLLILSLLDDFHAMVRRSSLANPELA